MLTLKFKSKKRKSELKRRKDRERKLKKFQAFIRKVGSSVTDLSKGLDTLFRFPLRDLRKARKSSRSTWPHYLLMPLAVFPMGLAIIGKIFISPLEILVELVCRRFERLRWKLPALLAFVAIAVAFANGGWGWFGTENRIKSLLVSIESKQEAQDFDGAVRDYEKLLNLSGSRSQIDSDVHMAIVNASIQQGNDIKATELLNQLAPGPDGTPGLEAAHLMQAIRIANEINDGVGGETSLTQLQWHLNHSERIRTEEAYVTRAFFSEKIEKFDEAIRDYDKAASINPIHFMRLANVFAEMGKSEDRQEALEKARLKFEEIVNEQPENEEARLILAKALTQLELYDECQEVLETGLARFDSRPFKYFCAEFYVSIYNRPGNRLSFAENRELLLTAFQLAPDIRSVQQAINALYTTSDNPEDKASIIEALEIAALDKSLSRNANFVISVLLSQEEKMDDAIAYCEKAYQTDPNSPPYNNNLAWQLAHAEKPDLDRALKLAQFAVDASPGNGSFRDTLGTILIKLSRHQQAISELKKALLYDAPAVSEESRISVHEKLADCHDLIGLAVEAKKYRRQAAEAKVELEQGKSLAK